MAKLSKHIEGKYEPATELRGSFLLPGFGRINFQTMTLEQAKAIEKHKKAKKYIQKVVKEPPKSNSKPE